MNCYHSYFRCVCVYIRLGSTWDLPMRIVSSTDGLIAFLGAASTAPVTIQLNCACGNCLLGGRPVETIRFPAKREPFDRWDCKLRQYYQKNNGRLVIHFSKRFSGTVACFSGTNKHNLFSLLRLDMLQTVKSCCINYSLNMVRINALRTNYSTVIGTRRCARVHSIFNQYVKKCWTKFVRFSVKNPVQPIFTIFLILNNSENIDSQ